MRKKTNIAKATGSVSLCTLASRVLGLVRDMAIARWFGAGDQTDAFFVAFKIPNLLRRLVAEGALASAFVPVFTTELSDSENSANKAIRATCGFTLILTTVLCVAGIIFADQITALFAPGFLSDPSKFALARDLTRILFPYIVLVSLLSVASSVLNVLGYFALPAFAPAILNISMIIAVLFFAGYGIDSLAWAVLAGGLLALIPQLRLLKKLGFSFLPANPISNPAVKTLAVLMLPAVLSASVYQLMVFINTLLASYLEKGSVSWLYYADRLFQFPLGIFSIAIATALLPALSRAAAEKDEEMLTRQLTAGINWVSFVILPASAGLILLSQFLVEAIYAHGNFSDYSAKQTSIALVAFAVGLWPISCQSLLARAFLAKKNTLIPAVISIFSLVINLICALSLMGSLNSSPNYFLTNFLLSCQNFLPNFALGHAGLALAGSFTSFLTLVALLLCLPKVKSNLPIRPLVETFIKSLLASLLMALTIKALLGFKMGSLLTLIVCVPAGILVYAFSSLGLGIREADQVKTTLLRRFATSRFKNQLERYLSRH